jgi:hypothetical protein
MFLTGKDVPAVDPPRREVDPILWTTKRGN